MEERGYTLLMGNMRLYQKYGNLFYKEENYDSLVEDEVQQMLAKRVEGIIYIEGHYHVMDNISELFSVPLVAVYGRVKILRLLRLFTMMSKAVMKQQKNCLQMDIENLGLSKEQKQAIIPLKEGKDF